MESCHSERSRGIFQLSECGRSLHSAIIMASVGMTKGLFKQVLRDNIYDAMKKSEKRELKSKSKEELTNMVDELRNEMKKIVVEINAGRLKNVSLLREKKRDIACILTILREKNLLI